jgi:two-component system, NarL family, sensor histidine kinase DegS
VPMTSLRISLKKSFLYRAQAVFYGRLSLNSLYLLLWILAFFDSQSIFPNSKLDLALILSAMIYSLICYQYKAHKSLGRWLHFASLTLDIAMHLWLTRTSLYLLSPLMAIHPFLSAAFLLLFHNPLLMMVPLSVLPVATILCFNAQGTVHMAPMLSSLLIYGGLDILAIFFIHLAHSKEHKLLTSMVGLEKKLKELAIIKERQRISREFHDGVGAKLASIAMQCDYLQLKNHQDPEIAEIKDSALESIDDMRRSVAFLQGDFDIAEQTEFLVENFERRHGLAIRSNGFLLLGKLTLEQQIACCRIFEEALTNALKHAKATLVSITINNISQGLRVIINDNGIGFDVNIKKKHHYGIKNMANRAQQMGAQLSFDSLPNQGTTISLEIPTA